MGESSLHEITFAGRPREDPEDYLDWVKFQVMRHNVSTTKDRDLVSRFSFRQGLRGRARTWYENLEKDVKNDWEKLEERFAAEYKDNENFVDPRVIHTIANFARNNGQSIPDFLRRGERLSRTCPTEYGHLLAARTLDNMTDGDKGKVEKQLVMVTLRQDGLVKNGLLQRKVTFDQVRRAIVECCRDEFSYEDVVGGDED